MSLRLRTPEPSKAPPLRRPPGRGRPNPPRPGPPPSRGPRRILLLGILLVLASLGGTLGWWQWREWHRPPPPPPPAPPPIVAGPALAARSELATTEMPWPNSLQMHFVPVSGTKVLFAIWKTRVQDYELFARETRRAWSRPGFEQSPLHPAVMVSWEDAHAFCAWLTAREHQARLIAYGQKYRLPTDEEWSVAAGLNKERGDTPAERDMRIKDRYPWGTNWPPPVAAGNYNDSLRTDGFPYTSPVGSFAANVVGLYDLGGNTWEWCEDWYEAEPEFRVLRGASWTNGPPFSLLCSFRCDFVPGFHNDQIGFRVVLTRP